MQRSILLALPILVLLLVACGSDAPTPTPATPSPTVEPSPTGQLNQAMLERRWTVLFVGVDLNQAREERNEPASTDALLLASLSADQSELAFVSLPRDTVDVPRRDGETWERKINALYREEGLDALVEALEELYGIAIDAHVALDMDDFGRVLDAVGEIEVSPDEPLRDPIVDLDLEAGPQQISPGTARGYVRSRVDQDYGRMERQQEVMLAVLEKLVDEETDLDLRPLLEGLDSLETDLPLDELPTLLELASRAADADVERLVIEPPLITFEGDRGDGRGYILQPDVEAIRDEVQGLIRD